jgi:hypothetical protein
MGGPRLTDREREARALDDIIYRVKRAWHAYRRWCEKTDPKNLMTRQERIEAYNREIGEDG